jgi:hypothetical protein
MDAMSDATRSIQSPERLRGQAIAALVPFFLEGPNSDVQEAREIAAGLLDDYRAVTPRELQLAAQIIAQGWAVMACLRTAVAATNLSVMEKLTLQESAIKLDRASQKSTKALEASQKQRAKNPNAMGPEQTDWHEGEFQRAINQALEKLTDANMKLAACMAKPGFQGSVPVGGAAVPRAPQQKRIFLAAEQMTPTVLARRARH